MLRARFERLFRGNEDWYGQYEANPKTGAKLKAYTKAGPIPDEAWDRHLTGEKTGIGIVPIGDDGTCYWGCIDLDDDDTDHRALLDNVKVLGLPFVVCRSKSGGAHLFLFFLEPVKPVHVIAKLRRWSEMLGLKNPKNERGRVTQLEYFPKQLSLQAGQAGNWLNLPYFGGDNTTRYCIDDAGEPMTVVEFLDHAEAMRLTETELEVKQVRLTVDHQAFFIDGPPCLQKLHELGLPDGTRNQGLLNIGIYLKLKFPDDWEDLLTDYNLNSGKLNPPLPEDEIRDLVRSLGRSDYRYRCRDEPVEKYCVKAACRRQDFGIDGFERIEAHGLFPVVSRLVSFENGLDDPLYELEIGGKTMTLIPDELSSMLAFKRVAFRQTKIQVPQLKLKDWDTKVRELIRDHIVVEVPADAGPQGQFMARLSEFLMLRKRSDRDEDLLDNKPWEHGGRVYFRSIALIEFLEHFRSSRPDLNSVGIWSVIRRNGGGFTSLKVAGTDLGVWWVPLPTNEQTDDYKEKSHERPSF